MYTRRAAYAAEFLGTFLLVGTFALMWANLGMAVNPRGDRAWAPWVIGARLGLAVMTVYVAAPVVGALLAGVGYRLVALEPPVAAPVPETVQEPFAA